MASIKAPQSWKKPDEHIQILLNSRWYKILAKLYKSIFEATHDFYKKESISPMMLPITTGAISSPMGKGCDSVPVQVIIKGQKVYLADSMQLFLFLTSQFYPLYVSGGVIRLFDNFVAHTGNLVVGKWQ